MNALRKEREDENLSTADLVNTTRDRERGEEPMTPRQAYAAGEPIRTGPGAGTGNPPDYIPPQQARGPQPVPSAPTPSQVPPAAPVAAVPAQVQQPNSGSRPAPVSQTTSSPASEAAPAQLFPDDELHNYRARWDQVQASFVDEPRKAVESADSLVANVVKRIAEQFAAERENLEKQWDRGDNVNTEDLRQALRRYRSFFDRLLRF